MNLNLITDLFKSFSKEPSISASMTLPTFSVPKPLDQDKRPRENILLSAHFSLYELTITGNTALQAKNRELTDNQVLKAHYLANLGEQVRELIARPVFVHSGYRCPEVNGTTAGSSKTSQHPLFEAMDFTPASFNGLQDLSNVFNTIWNAAKMKKIKFGQLILEQAKRDYGVAYWVHISLGAPYRDLARCGEVMCMKNGTYTLLGRV